MKNSFTKIFLTLCLFKIYINQCGSKKELESNLSELFENKKFDDVETSVLNEKFVGGELRKINGLKDPIYHLSVPKNDENLESFSNLKKFTETLPKSEFQNFSYFIGCFEEKDNLNLIFGNYFTQEINADLITIKNRGEKLKILSKIFSLLNLIQNQDFIINFEKYFRLYKINGKYIPFFLLISDFFYKKKEITDKMKFIFESPEENGGKFIYPESNTYSIFFLFLFLNLHEDLPNVEDLIFNLTNKKLETLIKNNNNKENHDLLIQAISNIFKSEDIPFIIKKPNVFTRFGTWILSFFKDQTVQMSYDFGDLAKAVLTFKKEDRPNCQAISDKLLYFSNNIEEKVQLSGENNKEKLEDSEPSESEYKLNDYDFLDNEMKDFNYSQKQDMKDYHVASDQFENEVNSQKISQENYLNSKGDIDLNKIKDKNIGLYGRSQLNKMIF